MAMKRTYCSVVGCYGTGDVRGVMAHGEKDSQVRIAQHVYRVSDNQHSGQGVCLCRPLQ